MQGSQIFANYESTGVGLDSSTTGIEYFNYKFNSALGMLFVSFILFSSFGLYMDKVMPSAFGQRLSPFFCCKRSYWRPNEYEQQRFGAAEGALVSSEDDEDEWDD